MPISLNRLEHIAKRRRHKVAGWVRSPLQRRKMRLAAFDLGIFLAAQVVGEQAALGLDDEIQTLRAILVEQDSPVRVVRP